MSRKSSLLSPGTKAESLAVRTSEKTLEGLSKERSEAMTLVSFLGSRRGGEGAAAALVNHPTLRAGGQVPLHKKAPKTHKRNEGAGEGGRRELSKEQPLRGNCQAIRSELACCHDNTLLRGIQE